VERVILDVVGGVSSGTQGWSAGSRSQLTIWGWLCGVLRLEQWFFSGPASTLHSYNQHSIVWATHLFSSHFILILSSLHTVFLSCHLIFRDDMNCSNRNRCGQTFRNHESSTSITACSSPKGGSWRCYESAHCCIRLVQNEPGMVNPSRKTLRHRKNHGSWIHRRPLVQTSTLQLQQPTIWIPRQMWLKEKNTLEAINGCVQCA
jgi:hypothetical protein